MTNNKKTSLRDRATAMGKLECKEKPKYEFTKINFFPPTLKLACLPAGEKIDFK
ncbi:MAG: hypothetical protein Q8S41_10785 [Lutibacter sp.]|nr:hypothetical protein [Lutibacter sp.]